MPRADQRLYAALLRLGRRFQAARIPLIGVAGSEVVCHNLNWQQTLRAAIESPTQPGVGLAEGMRMLSMLQSQLDTLSLAEEHTREALAEWAALAERFGGSRWQQSTSSGSSGSSSSSGGGGGGGSSAVGPPRLPFAASAAAAEEGLALLSRQAQELANPLLFLEAELESSTTGDGGEPAAVSLDELAEAVRQQYPALFPATPDSSGSSMGISGGSSGSGSLENGSTLDGSSSGSSTLNGNTSASSSSSGSGLVSGTAGGTSSELRVQQAAAVGNVVYRQHRFKFEPFEWVYEGLSPLLLPPRVQRRKLAPVTLAVLVAGVARRLGLPLLPVPAELGEEIAAGVAQGPAGGAAAQSIPMEQLRPDVAQRYAGRAGAMAPVAGLWVLLLAGEGGTSLDSSSSSAAPSRAAGGAAPGAGAATGAEGRQRQAVQEQGWGQEWTHVMDARNGRVMEAIEAQRTFPELQLGMDWQLYAPLLTWQHMIKTIIQAHQRRGESDLVAHWVYVLLALDPQAPEWQHMLAASPLHSAQAA